jgi:hypothetical protein
MTKVQFEIYTIICGMMMEGCSKDEALAYTVLMEYKPEDIKTAMEKL